MKNIKIVKNPEETNIKFRTNRNIKRNEQSFQTEYTVSFFVKGIIVFEIETCFN